MEKWCQQRSMKLKIKYYLCGVTLLLVYLFIKNWNFEVVHHENPNARIHHDNIYNKDIRVEDEVTLVIRYSHENSKYLVETVNSFLSQFPSIPVVIVSDTILSREITYSFLNSTFITNIPLKLDLLNLVVDRNVANYVRTKYVFIAPIGVVSLSSIEIKNLIKTLNQSNGSLFSLPVEKKPFKCLKLKLNLLQWSIQYKKNDYSLNCDSIQGDHGIVMLSEMLHKIGEPFLMPFPEAFYIQTTSLKMNIKPVHNVMLRSKHKNGKRTDLLQKNQIYRQIMNKQFKIKKVIRETGVIEWYGCTRQTPRCFPSIVNSTPDFLNQGRWTPPCCLKVLRETVHHVFKVLTESNVTFWLEGGSLLGAMRLKDIIPWDYDVDIGVYLQDINKCPWLHKLNEQVFKEKQLPSVVDGEGFVWEKADPEEGDFYRVQASVHNRLHIDIFPFFPKNGVMTKKTWFASHPQDMEFPEHYLKPLTTIEFAGIQAPAPNNVKEFLELKFGKGCVENPQYPNPKLFPFPENAKPLVINETFNYDLGLSLT